MARDPSVLTLCVSVWGTLLISAVGLVLVLMPIHSGAGGLPGMRGQPIPANGLRERCSKNVFESKRTPISAKLVSRTASLFLYLSTAVAGAQRPSLQQWHSSAAGKRLSAAMTASDSWTFIQWNNALLKGSGLDSLSKALCEVILRSTHFPILCSFPPHVLFIDELNLRRRTVPESS